MTITFDVLEVLTYILIASVAAFLLSGSVFVYGIHRYDSAAIGTCERRKHLSLSFGFYALVMVFVAFFFMLASSALILWLQMLMAGVI